MGYGHLMGRIVPAMLRRGVPEQRITELLVDRPAALLDRPDDPLDHPAEEPA
jgi:phosphotriesterase-related protein